jgi:hypothetical protein
MIKAFGAPIDPADAKTIGDYLKQNYGERSGFQNKMECERSPAPMGDRW